MWRKSTENRLTGFLKPKFIEKKAVGISDNYLWYQIVPLALNGFTCR